MKKPTTPYSVDVQEKAQINREFLESKGWVLEEEKPLYETYKHKKDSNVLCSIGLYGSFSICELHWLNQTPETQFSTMNPNLTKYDYSDIIRLLNFKNIL